MALTDKIKTKAEKMHEVIMKIPDKFLVGPMTKSTQNNYSLKLFFHTT